MDYIKLIKKMSQIHCARGPSRCEKCRKLEEEGKKFCLIKAYLKAGKIARPMTEIVNIDKKILCEYDVEKVFRSEKEAKAYAIDNGIEFQ